MEKQIENRKYLCIKFFDVKTGSLNPVLSKCPANPEMVMAAMQFIASGYRIEISVEDNPIDFIGDYEKLCKGDL